MKKTLTFLTLAFLSFGLLAFDAEAKRMGGGKNIGTQRQAVNKQQATPTPQQAPAAAPAASSGSKWGGALAGLAAGGLLAALFIAFENINMMDFVVLALLIGAVFFIIRMLRKPKTEAHSGSMQYSGMSTATQDRFNTPPSAAYAGATASSSAGNTSQAQPNIPADFQVEPFLRNTKMSFIRLQAAHDRGDINEIRDYATGNAG